jgi:hypothetical protein
MTIFHGNEWAHTVFPSLRYRPPEKDPWETNPGHIVTQARDSVWVLREGLDISATQQQALGNVATLFSNSHLGTLSSSKQRSAERDLTWIIRKSAGYPAEAALAERYAYVRQLGAALTEAADTGNIGDNPSDLLSAGQHLVTLSGLIDDGFSAKIRFAGTNEFFSDVPQFDPV